MVMNFRKNLNKMSFISRNLYKIQSLNTKLLMNKLGGENENR